MGDNVQHVRLDQFKLPAQFPNAAAATQPHQMDPAILQGSKRCLQACPLALGVDGAGGVLGDDGQDPQRQACCQGTCRAHVAQQADDAHQCYRCTGSKHGAAVDIIESFPGQRGHGRRRKAQPDTQPANGAAFQVAAAAQPEVTHLVAPEGSIQKRPCLLQKRTARRADSGTEPGQPLLPIAGMAIDGQLALGAVAGVECMYQVRCSLAVNGDVKVRKTAIRHSFDRLC